MSGDLLYTELLRWNALYVTPRYVYILRGKHLPIISQGALCLRISEIVICTEILIRLSARSYDAITIASIDNSGGLVVGRSCVWNRT